jgi:hypothetical protein
LSPDALVLRHRAEVERAERIVRPDRSGEALIDRDAVATVDRGQQLLRTAGVAAAICPSHREPAEEDALVAVRLQ